MLAERELYVSELAPVTVDLESVFLELTGDRAGAGPGPAGRRLGRRRSRTGRPGPAAPQAARRRGRVGRMSLYHGGGAPAVQAPVHPHRADPRRCWCWPPSRSAFFIASHKVGPETRVAAEAEAQAETYDQVTRDHATMVAQCEAAQGARAPRRPSSSTAPNCAQGLGADARAVPRRVTTCRTTFDFRDEFPIIADRVRRHPRPWSAFVIGASFVGAEWNSGGMMNLLLWRPQRLTGAGAPSWLRPARRHASVSRWRSVHCGPAAFWADRQVRRQHRQDDRRACGSRSRSTVRAASG